MKNFILKKKNFGFTLIELLVVVAIISLLSSIVMASLNSARGKAKDASIKESVSQLVNLMELEYNDNGNYSNLRPQAWIQDCPTCSGITCSTMSISGTYATNFREICKNIFNNAYDIQPPVGGYRLLLYTAQTNNSIYSIMVALNNGKWLCSGSSGRKTEYTPPININNPGCHGNP